MASAATPSAVRIRSTFLGQGLLPEPVAIGVLGGGVMAEMRRGKGLIMAHSSSCCSLQRLSKSPDCHLRARTVVSGGFHASDAGHRYVNHDKQLVTATRLPSA